MQAKHQPLQFLSVSTLREYLRYEFMDLVGPATDPPPASELAAYGPWHQEEKDPPELAPGDDDSDTASGNSLAVDEEAETPLHADTADRVKSGHNSAEPSIADPAETTPRSGGHAFAATTGGANAQGRFNFERVLQDFVLLSFLVSS